MKSIVLRTTKIETMFNQLHHAFGGTLNVDLKEYILEVNNDLGQGQIKGITFKGGISYVEFDMTFYEDIELIASTTQKAPICFAYCSRGKVAHSFGARGEKRELENFQTGILSNVELQDNILYFEKDINLMTSLIAVSTLDNTKVSEFKKNNLQENLEKLFCRENENFIYIGSYNLKIAEKIQELNTISQKGLVRKLLIEGLVHTILAMEIQQHTDDLKNRECNTGSLNSREMDSVNEISQFIKNYPETQLCIAQLSRKSGLSPSKLQEGFKLMHGTTVTDFIRDIRVQKAEDLIKHTDLNISEVVYSIGFTSRSYFSKIFKQKYNCSPKQYKDHQHTLAISI